MADIAINPVSRRVQFTGNTGTGPFAFTFNILADEDIAVYKNTTLLTLTTDYTVATNADGTGSVTLVAALIASDVLTIIGGRELERTTDFVTAGDLLAASLNEQLDSLVIMAQQLDEKLTRAVKVNPGDVFTDLELPGKDARKGTVLGFNATSGDPEAGPEIADVQSLAAITADIATLADIEDGTDATDAIQTVAGISSDVTTVSGINANVTTVAGISSNVTAVANDATDIGTVATNIASVNTVATNIADVITVANDLNEAVSEVVTVADDLNEAVSEIDTVAGSISNVDAVGTNIANVNTVAGISSNVTTVAGISSDTTTVAGISGNVTTVASISSDVTAVAADATDIGTVATNISNVNAVAGNATNINSVAGNATNINAVAADASDIGTVAGISANVTTVANLSSSVSTLALISSDITTVAGISANVTTVAGDTANIATIATDLNGSDNIGTVAGSISNVNSVGGSISNVNTVATNLSSINDFADKYRIGATDPTTSLDEGDLFYNTTSNTLKVYTGSAWEQGVTAGSGFLPLTGGGLTGNLTFGDNDKAIFGAGSDLEVYHDGSNSRILENGTGFLAIGTNGGEISLRGDSFNDFMLKAEQNSAVTLYHNALPKLATTSTGVDITGTLTSDGLTVDTNTLHVDSTNNRVGIGTSSPNDKLEVLDGALMLKSSSASGYPNLKFENGSQRYDVQIDGATQAFRIVDNTASAERMRIDSSGNLLVGMTSNGITSTGIGLVRDGTSHMYSGGTHTLELGRGTNDGDILKFNRSGTTVGSIGSVLGVDLFIAGNRGAGQRYLQSNILPCNASGTINDNTLDLGSSSNRYKDLYLSGTSYANNTQLDLTATNSDSPIAVKIVNNASGSGTGGRVVMGAGSGSLSQTAGVAGFFDGTGTSLALYTSSSYGSSNQTERLRVDRNGNLLVGKTSTSSTTAGGNIFGGLGSFVRDGNSPLSLNRRTNDGEIISFAAQDSIVGNISAKGGDLSIGTGDTGITFADGSDYIGPWSTSGNALRGSSIDIGAGGAKFKDGYFSGTVNAANFNTTSDATLKTNVKTLTGSLDAVKALRGVSYDWIENGNSEVGVIAQEVEEVIPDVVSTDDQGIKSVKYGNLVGVLIEAIKEQQAQIDELKARLGD